MPCNSTSYPHGTIPANRPYRLGETAESKCSDICIEYTHTVIVGPDALLEDCNTIINGGTPEFESGDLPIFDYVGEDMVCSPCSVECTDFQDGEIFFTGCKWIVGIEYCCIDGQYVGPNGVSGPC